jgi:hypothetical protein
MIIVGKISFSILFSTLMNFLSGFLDNKLVVKSSNFKITLTALFIFSKKLIRKKHYCVENWLGRFIIMVYLYENIRWVKNLTKKLYFDCESFFSGKITYKLLFRLRSKDPSNDLD